MVTPRYLADATLLITILSILYSELEDSGLFEMVRCSYFFGEFGNLLQICQSFVPQLLAISGDRA